MMEKLNMRDLKYLTLITDTSKLDGTTYIELLPGIYKNKCWNEESAFIDAEHPDYNSLEKLFAEHFEDFDPYSFQTYSKSEWLDFLDLLQEYNSDKIPNSFIEDFSSWFKKVLEVNDEVTFMGL